MSTAPTGVHRRWRLGVDRQLADLRKVPRIDVGDVLGGLSVAMVLIPQSLAYADLAGLPPTVGLFASAFPLLVFAMFASSPYLQTGPVAMTSLITAGVLAGLFDRESVEYVEAATLLAVIVGVTRVLIGVARLGAVVYLMAEPVTMGFISGAGIVILASQLPKALGVTLSDEVAGWSSPLARAGWSIVSVTEWRPEAIVMSVATLVLMLFGRRVHRLFPGVLVAVIVAIVYAMTVGYSAPMIGELDAGIPSWSTDLPWDRTGSLLIGGLVIATIGFAEPASLARTFAKEDQSRWSSSREFFASGLANTVAGFTGAYPVGGSLSRSSVNRFAGARTRWSGAVTGLVVLGFLPFAGVLENLPQAVLGAIVIGAVLALIRPGRLVRMWERSPWQAALAWITFAATLITPPNVHYAVLLGIVATGVVHVVRRFRLEVRSDDETLHIRPRGLLWIATIGPLKRQLREVIESDGGSGPVVVSLDRSTAIDGAIADAIAGGMMAAERNGRAFAVENPPEGAVPILANFDVAVVAPAPGESVAHDGNARS